MEIRNRALVKPENEALSQEGQSYSFAIVYAYFLMIFVFGFYFYEFLGFDPLDELLELGLIPIVGLYLFENKLYRPRMDVLMFIFIAGFYIVYSFVIHSNTPSAIVSDAIVQLKPYIGFYAFYYLGVVFTPSQKKALRMIIILLFVVALGVVVYGGLIGNLMRAFVQFYSHPSRYASALIVCGMFYLYLSDLNKKNVAFYILMMTFALLSLRSKTYGFYVGSLFLLFTTCFKVNLKFNFKSMILVGLLFGLVLFVAREKILFYFVDNSMADKDSLARTLLYATSFEILYDYFPFGSGLASYGTAASGAHYSNIYYEYNLDGIWGLEPHAPDFVADTYYPSLAQFGVTGVLLFIIFWRSLFKEALSYKRLFDKRKEYMIVLMVIMFFVIEFVADATFTNNRGMACMMLLALVMNEMRFNKEVSEEANVESIKNNKL